MINSGSDAPGAAACAGSHCWGPATGQMGRLGGDRAAMAGVTHRCHSPQWVTDKPCYGGTLWFPPPALAAAGAAQSGVSISHSSQPNLPWGFGEGEPNREAGSEYELTRE